jgi:OmpA-OmpF porin, OOP family
MHSTSGRSAALAMAATLLASTANAGDEPGFYAGAGVGSFGVDVAGYSARDVSFKVAAGYDFGKYLAMELEYIDGGAPEDFGVSIETTGINASVLGTWPVSGQFELFAKAGMFFWDIEIPDFGSDSGEDFSYGIGASYDFNESFGLRAEYQRFEIADADTIDLVAATAIWRF